MTTEPQPKTRTRPRSRRLSACYRHPSKPITGFCALCLQERLAGLEPSGEPSSSTCASAQSVTNTGVLGPELRRSKSVAGRKCEASSSSEPRRNSCDVRCKNTLSHLFDIDDERKRLNREIKVESKSLGLVFSRISETDNGEDVGDSEDVLVADVSGVIEEGDLMTMKEHIDLELESNNHKKMGDFMDIASVFTKKLQKWRQKQKNRKLSISQREVNGDDGDRIARETQSEVDEYGLGRRSCDTEPRFSVDANRISVDDSRIPFDEPRASWDGYLIARTIPRLTPMLPVVENMMSNRPEEQMHPIKEDETTSGLSAQSNSDSSSSQRQSSFDHSSSIRSGSMKALGLEVDDAKLVANSKVSPANSDVFNGSKLVITEKELKDWHLNSIKDDHPKSLDLVSKDATADALYGFKKVTRWWMSGNIWGFKNKLGDKKNEDIVGKAIPHPVAEPCEEQSMEVDGVENGVSSSKLVRSTGCVTSRDPSKMFGSNESMLEIGDCAKKGAEGFVLERSRSTKYSPSKFDDGRLQFYLPPFRSSRRTKSGKGSAKNLSPALAGDILRLS